MNEWGNVEHHTVEDHPAMKSNTPVAHTAARATLKNNMLSEKNPDAEDYILYNSF